MKPIKQALEKKAHEFRRTVQKAYIEVHRKTSLPRLPKSPYHNECLEICKKMLSNKDTVLLVAPISSRWYMKNDHFGIYVVLGKRTVEVINHVYNYTVPLDEETWKDVIDEFNKELEERRITMEKEISANIKYSLKNVIKGMEVKDEHK